MFRLSLTLLSKMASMTLRGLKAARTLKSISSLRSLSTTRVLSGQGTTGWYKDFKPGKYPETQKEREAAAKKYGLIPEDYKPYPATEGDNYGDYPELPVVTDNERDPYEDWDYPGIKRNYGEPVHLDQDNYAADRVNPIPAYHKYPLWKQVLMLASVLTGFTFLAIFTDRYFYRFFQPMMPKQFPYPQIELNNQSVRKRNNCYENSKHYSYEKA